MFHHQEALIWHKSVPVRNQKPSNTSRSSPSARWRRGWRRRACASCGGIEISAWIDDFESNKLDRRWVATRLSQGGQNNGVWTREVKDSKVYWVGVSVGTENGWWGEKISLPVNATGDIIIEASMRQKGNAAINATIGVGFNFALLSYYPRYGCALFMPGAGANYKEGFNAGTATTFPGFPSKSSQPASSDIISNVRVIRKNGYVFLYMDGLFVGSYAYAPAITTVDIMAAWYIAEVSSQKWVDWIKVWPSSVVL